MESIAIAGMACRYADVHSPGELWENALAQRQAFRRIPEERLRVEDYTANPDDPDSLAATMAALLEDWEFDRVRFRVPRETFASADPSHWLALTVAEQALCDARLLDAVDRDRERTAVFIGNTLTGEMARANAMRLRWPYVRRVMAAAIMRAKVDTAEAGRILASAEELYKAPFPPTCSETLAGNLSNTISGRISNHFDLKGGCYTVDGACASSLLAIAHGCAALAAGEIDFAIAGGVDLSLDPFELVGFSRAGALARERMRVYDARSDGFWPGEGCGMVVLMREADAAARRIRPHALIRGWGISSDGSGGITRPETKGQLLALRRAYQRAGYGIHTPAYFEGHGTGTAVGDTTEIRALSMARLESGPGSPAAGVGSIKANIGHTKAAAGVAGLLKAVMAVKERILPPTTGCEIPHPAFAEFNALRPLHRAEPWPENAAPRAGVSAMGFGGINTHVTIEACGQTRPQPVFAPRIFDVPQDAEAFFFSADSRLELESLIGKVAGYARRLSRAELTDLAAALSDTARERAFHRAAVVAGSAEELANRLEHVLEAVRKNGCTDVEAGIFASWEGAGCERDSSRIGFLFSGQAAPVYVNGGIWTRRFPGVEALYRRAALRAEADGSTRAAQPAIVTSSMAGLLMLAELGIEASAACGHSLGELTALHWAGAIDSETLLRIARGRGELMESHGAADGAMASIHASEQEVRDLLDGTAVVIAADNAPNQTVIAGDAAGVAEVTGRARRLRWGASALPVKRAFHSPLIAAAVPPFRQLLETVEIGSPVRRVLSTVEGRSLDHDSLEHGCDLRDLLCRQITSKVRFREALEELAGEVDLLIEVGPGGILSNLARQSTARTAIALDCGGASLNGLLSAACAAFVAGAPVRREALFTDRFVRPFGLDWNPRFLKNPCESAPVEPSAAVEPRVEGRQTAAVEPPSEPDKPTDSRALDVLRTLLAGRMDLPVSAITENTAPLSDLHLNSITVSQIVAQVARAVGANPMLDPLSFVNLKLSQIADILEQARGAGAAPGGTNASPDGIDSWVRAFSLEWVETTRPRRAGKSAGEWRVFGEPGDTLAERLRTGLAAADGGGVVVCVPARPDERCLELLLASAKAALDGSADRFIMVQRDSGASALARTVHIENAAVNTVVITMPDDHDEAVDWIRAEAAAALGFVEARYDRAGRRTEPRLTLLPQSGAAEMLATGSVVLVSGGGKGITAECALALARSRGLLLAIIGRSDPETDRELSLNLARMGAAGVRYGYFRADVAELAEVEKAVAAAQTELGPIAAVLHGAGFNSPQLIPSLDVKQMARTLDPKLGGLRNILSAVDKDRLRLLITFGSLIARTGLRGEADYALANQWLGSACEEAAQNKTLRCLHIDWSVWAGAGMGERLGTVESLMRQGISPIPLQEGIRMFERLVCDAGVSGSIVVTGRFGQPPTLKYKDAVVPLARFLENVRVYVPRVELVADAELTPDSDPYLKSHTLDGDALFPAVLGLEAMAQAVSVLRGDEGHFVFENVEFARPIVASSATTLRVCALDRVNGTVDVALRCSDTNFLVDHFRASCSLSSTGELRSKRPPSSRRAVDASGFYGSLLFQNGAFRRVSQYLHMRATECCARIEARADESWFARELPSALILGDPGARDGAIHCIQACIPHAAVLPLGVDRIEVFRRLGDRPVFAMAKERSGDGRTFVYDLDVVDEAGVVAERWQGLRLQALERSKPFDLWPAPLFANYLERQVGEFIPDLSISVAFEHDASAAQHARRATALGKLTGPHAVLTRRSDGKPELHSPALEQEISFAHSGPLTLAVLGAGEVGCDVETTAQRSAGMWGDLLGAERLALARLVSERCGEPFDTAATRVWTVMESLAKAGMSPRSPVVLRRIAPGGCVVFASGEASVVTALANVQSVEGTVVIGIAGKKRAGNSVAA